MSQPQWQNPVLTPLTLQIPDSPLPVILDTDLGNDVDDALALAFLHELERRRRTRLLGVVLNNSDPLAAPLVDAINAFYGRPDIPVAVRPDGVRLEESKFLGLAEERTPGGELVFPRPSRTYEPAVRALRRHLAEAGDGSVSIVSIGFLTNLASLLKSEADDISPLDGASLVRARVSCLSVMAGAFQTVRDNNRFLEFNVVHDIRSAQEVAEAWPTPVYWSGVEVGRLIGFPAYSVDEDMQWVERHPIRESYQRYIPTPHERPTWDLTSIAWVAFPERGYFGLSSPGSVRVEDDGYTRFLPGEAGRHRFLTIDAIQAARLRELFAAYVCAVPARLA